MSKMELEGDRYLTTCVHMVKSMFYDVKCGNCGCVHVAKYEDYPDGFKGQCKECGWYIREKFTYSNFMDFSNGR